MEITISGRHMEVTEAMQKQIREHVGKLPRFDDQIQHVTATLINDPAGQKVEVIAKCHKAILVANGQSHDVYLSIDQAFEKLQKRITRFHDKLTTKHAREAQQSSESAKRPE